MRVLHGPCARAGRSGEDSARAGYDPLPGFGPNVPE
jgi:hypothetical protein